AWLLRYGEQLRPQWAGVGRTAAAVDRGDAARAVLDRLALALAQLLVARRAEDAADGAHAVTVADRHAWVCRVRWPDTAARVPRHPGPAGLAIHAHRSAKPAGGSGPEEAARCPSRVARSFGCWRSSPVVGKARGT